MVRSPWIVGAFVGMLLVPALSSPARADPYLDLINYLSPNSVPDGTGIRAALIEPSSGGGIWNYLPSLGAGNPFPTSEAVNDVTNAPGTLSAHASGLASTFYEAGSIARGISQVDAYDAENWLLFSPSGYPAFMQATSVVRGASTLAPRVFAYSGGGGNIQVANCSWIGNFSGADRTFLTVDALRRTDLVVQRDGTVIVVGAALTPIPDIMANAYNVIAVGVDRTVGGSNGPSTADVPGRSKPDIIAEGDVSTAVTNISASAAVLLDSANRLGPAYAQATHPEAIKAILMAGATKTALWTRFDNGTYVEPLDRHDGAGLVNIYNSYRILEGGRQPGVPGLSAANNINTYGWDYGNLASGQQELYYFSIAAGDVADQVSVIASWLRHVAPAGFDPGNGLMVFSATLPQLNLELWSAGPAGDLLSILDQSVSPIDNVQGLYEVNLGPGRYAFRLSYVGTDYGPWDYALAWRGANFSPAAPAEVVPEPSGIALLAIGAGLCAWAAARRRRGVAFSQRAIRGGPFVAAGP